MEPTAFIENSKEHSDSHNQITNIRNNCPPFIMVNRQDCPFFILIVRRLEKAVPFIIQHVVHIYTVREFHIPQIINNRNFAGIGRWAVRAWITFHFKLIQFYGERQFNGFCAKTHFYIQSIY